MDGCSSRNKEQASVSFCSHFRKHTLKLTVHTPIQPQTIGGKEDANNSMQNLITTLYQSEFLLSERIIVMANNHTHIFVIYKCGYLVAIYTSV